MKTIAICLLFSQTLIAADRTNNSGYGFSKKELLAAMILAFNTGLASASNGTNTTNCSQTFYPPFTLTDTEVEIYSWWQIGTALFAIGMIINNVVAPCVYSKKATKDHIAILKAHIESVKKDNERLKGNLALAEEVLEMLNCPQ